MTPGAPSGSGLDWGSARELPLLNKGGRPLMLYAHTEVSVALLLVCKPVCVLTFA